MDIHSDPITVGVLSCWVTVGQPAAWGVGAWLRPNSGWPSMSRSRKIARIIGYPAGLGLLVAAVYFPFGDTQDRLVVEIICGFVGFFTLAWAWATDRRRRIEVTEQHVTVVNSFSRYHVAWHELSDIEFEEIQNGGRRDRVPPPGLRHSKQTDSRRGAGGSPQNPKRCAPDVPTVARAGSAQGAGASAF